MNRARNKFAFSAVFVWVFSLLIFTSVFAEKENDPDKARTKSLINAYEQGVKLTVEEKAFIQDYIDNKLIKSKKTFSFYSPTATVALEEHFTTGVLPTGWQNVDNIGGGEVWYFDNPGARTINTTTGADGFAIFDSDFNGSAGGAEDADLITPPIDCSALAQVYLNFEHYFNSGFGGAAEVFVSGDNGATWTSLESWGASSTPNAEFKEYNISAVAAGQSQVLIKWNWTGDYSWYWAVDDVVVFEPSVTYSVLFVQDGGNPNGINTTSDIDAVSNWDTLVDASQAANIWSAAEAIPFPFEFYGQPVTHLKASLNGLVTFDTTATGTPPDGNTNLPSSLLPDMTIACMWDNFTLTPPTGTNDRVVTRTFGTAPNRQFWVKWFSFEWANVSFNYAAVVLEETSNKVYVVDMYNSTSPLLESTVGIQLDNSTATQYGDSTVAQGGNGSSNTDNDYYEFFIPSGDDIGAVYAEVSYSGFLLFANTSTTIRAAVQNLGTSDATNFDITYMVSDGSSSTETYTNVLASGATDTVTFATPWVPADSGNFDITVYTTYPPDGNPANDTTAISQVVTYVQVLNYQQDYEAYSGNPGTIGYYGANNEDFGFFTPSPTDDGSWTTDDFGNDPALTNSARFNFFSTTSDDKDWMITPPVDMTTSPPGGAPQLAFDIAATVFTGTDHAFIPPGDTLFVVASTDGQTWSRSNVLGMFTNADSIPAAGMRVNYDLSAYASETSLYIGFLAMDPPNAEDMNVYVDNLLIGVPPSLDVGPTALVTPVPGVFYGANEDVTVKVQNFGPSTIDFSVDPLTVNVDITGASTQNFSTVVNTGTLDPDSSFDVLVTGSADLTATGTHTFTMTTVIAGDGNPANDMLAADIVSSAILSTFPYLEHFDSTTAGAPGTLPDDWQNVPGDDLDWWVEASGTQNSTNTGPLNDNSGTGNYMYVEASSPNFPDMVANLHTPAFDISGLTDPALYFYFHMFGADMGELHVDAYFNGAWVLDIMPPLVGQYQTAETDPWIRRGVDLSGLGSPIMIRFRGITGAGFTSDMSIDDVTIGEAIPDVATTALNDPKLTMLSLSQIGLVSAIDIAATFSNNGPTNTGDLNTIVYDPLMSPVYANTVSGVTLNTFSDSIFMVGTADATGADPGDYTAAVFTSNFNDNFPANDTLYSMLNLGSTMAYDNGVQSTSGTFSSTARSWFAANYTLTDPDTIKSISILISASALATDSFAVEIWSVVNDEPSAPLVSVYEGAYSELGTLPALVQFDVPGGGYVVTPGTYAMVIDMKNTNSFPVGIDFTAQGAANIPRTFWGKLETSAWLPFETVGAGTWTPIMRAELGTPASGPPPVPLPYAESFDDTSMAIPAGWTRFELDGGDEVPGVDWMIDDGTGSGYPPQAGVGNALNWYQAADPTGYIDEWLVTPQMMDYQSGLHLSFYLKHVAGPWDDSLMVMVSTTGMDPADFTEIDYLNAPDEWTQFTYDLGNYGVMTGDDIYVAFRYLIYDGGSAGSSSNVITLDEVKVDTIPELGAPTNLTAQGGNGVVDLMWSPPVVDPGGTELFYDDGTAEGSITIGGTAEGDLAVRFTPNVYPSTLLQIKVHFATTADPTALTSIDYTIWDGTSTGPGTSLATGNQTINRGAFDLVDVSSHNIQITADDFFISYYEPIGNVMILSWDTNQPSANRSWVNAPGLGLPWQTSGTIGATFDNNYMIRAIVQEGSGPNARVVELSPNGERKVLSAGELKRLAAQNNTLGMNPATGAVSFDGTQLPQTGGHTSYHAGTPSLIEDLTGYNLYRSEDGTSFNFLATVDAMTLAYSDSAVTNGTDYWYYVTAVYPEGESEPSDTAMATPTAPTEFFDDFDSYTAGVQLVVQNSVDWTTWSNLPGSAEDPFVSDAHSSSGSNAVVLAQNNDLVKVFAPAPITSGIWKMSWQTYIPSGGAGYFNTLADFAGANSTWAMQVYFDAGGTGRLDAGGASAATFTYPYDTWMPVVVIVDLNTDAAEFWLNGTMIYSWQYTLGTFGTPTIPLQLDANNFFGATAVDEMYIDDYTVEPYIVGIDDEISALPTDFALEQNFPNPFNPTTTIKYALKENADVTLKIYNVLGQVVKTLVNEKQTAGFKELSWDGTNDFGVKVASGIYIYRIQANDFVQAKKMIMMK